MKNKLLAIAVLLILGAAKLPLEDRVTQALRQQDLLSQPLDLSLRESAGQMGFAAALGGLRSLVASITYLQAYVEFENVNWAKVDSLFQLTTRLQPHTTAYWDEASWHMAYNAATSYLLNKNMTNAVRGKLFQESVHRGIQILEEGLKFMPENPRLWTRLGDIYSRRTYEPLKAGECYLKGFQYGALPVYERLGAYEFAKTENPAALQRALNILQNAYDKNIRTPGVMTNLKTVREKLKMPPLPGLDQLDRQSGVK